MKNDIGNYNKQHQRILKATKSEGMKPAIDFASAQRGNDKIKAIRHKVANGFQPSLEDVVHNR